MQENTILILEGGAQRCLFTAGVLDALLEENVHFPVVAGVSAGALSGMNYVSGQIGRTAKINTEYANDKRYLSMRNLLKGQSIFNFDFLFGEISQKLVPMDYDAFYASSKRYLAFSTDIETGDAVIHEKGISEDVTMGARASSSMPLLAPPVAVDGRRCLDGAVAAAIPLAWALESGFEKIVLVLTRERGYQKPPTKRSMMPLYRRAYHENPVFAEKCITIPERYNALQQQISELEQQGRIFVIRPTEPVDVSRTEKDVGKLKRLYRRGKSITVHRMDALREYIK